ncbi:MAG: DUF91 domain-containing protein [Chloroflexi bacterium]|nr:DUF91 domain-containing protein [Chloroflexota bacterium]
MHYWMTTHWPPTEDVDLDDFEPEGIYLPDGREQAGNDIKIGDIVLIYQSRTGRAEKAYIKGEKVTIHCAEGRQGIIAIAEVVGNLKEIPGSEISTYVDGSNIWWRWHADTVLVSTNGFVPLSEVNRVLGYSSNNLLKGFGDYHSGLKKLEEDEFWELVRIFKNRPRKMATIRKAKKHPQKVSSGKSGGESDEHLNLKQYIASDPEKVLGESGLKTIKVEYEFPTGDRADIALEDSMGRIIGLEVELSVDKGQLEGILQAIKYRYMLALMEERKYYETRSFLVAHSIHNEMKKICDKYKVEYFIVDLDYASNP